MLKVISNSAKVFSVERGETICATFSFVEGVNSVKTIIVTLFEGEGEDVLRAIVLYLFHFSYVWDSIFIYGESETIKRLGAIIVEGLEDLGSYQVETGGGYIVLRPALRQIC